MGNIPGSKASFTKQCEECYWFAVRAKTEVEFEKHMNNLKALHPVAYDYLMNTVNLPRCMWTDYAFPMRTWGSITNNLAEQTMSWLGEAMRMKSPTAFLREALMRIMETRYRYWQEAVDRLNEVTFNTINCLQ
jgi:hypothetical protein